MSNSELLTDSLIFSDRMSQKVEEDYRRFAEQGVPGLLTEYIENRYDCDLSSSYAGLPIANPWGKASGQLSMQPSQVKEDVAAGLGFVVLKTVIAEDQHRRQSMEAWTIPEARMVTEQITGANGKSGWTVSWRGRGWSKTFTEYLEFVSEAQQLAADAPTLIVPSCKYHLPSVGEAEWNTDEYLHTTAQLLTAYRATGDRQPMPLEKDFSPTLAGSDRVSTTAQILSWLKTVPNLMRQTDPVAVRVGLKLFNALFDDEFQLEMLRAIHAAPDTAPDYYIYGNRLFDPDREFDGHRGIAVGGPDLSDRNLRVMSQFQQESPTDSLSWSATGNITTGKIAWEYALRGASSFQLHTYFQLPHDQYTLREGSRTQKALHELYFHPQHGFLVWWFALAERLALPRHPLRFRDVIGRGGELLECG